jgi:hypothetical protein
MRNATAECAQTADLQAPQVVIGHARVATEEQGTDPQLEELRAADCDAVCLEHTPSGADRTRPALARLLREIRSGETLVVVQLSRSNTGGWANIRQHKWPIFIVTAIIEQLEAMVYIFAVCATRSTPQRHKTCSHCRYCSPPRSRAHQGVAAHSAYRWVSWSARRSSGRYPQGSRWPRVETGWHPSSVEHLLARAEMFGLAGAPPAQVDPWVWR